MPLLTSKGKAVGQGQGRNGTGGRVARGRVLAYVGGMGWTAGIAVFLGTIAAMEGVAYAAHRWVMHGPGWFLHESHHRARRGAFELNDLYAAIFAVPSFVLLLGGMQLGWGGGWAWAGAGIAAYGTIYFGFHDWIVHNRLPGRYVARSAYMKRIMQAHRLHHVVETKEGTVSFGFLIAPRPDMLKAELKRRARAGVRAPATDRGAGDHAEAGSTLPA